MIRGLGPAGGRFVGHFVPSLALLYFIALGGTPLGEQLGLLRVVNTGLGAALILAYVARAPRATDRVDRLVLGALLLFAASALTSAFPRQSLDALLAAVAYVALFYLARDAVRQPALASALIWTMRIAAAGVAILVAIRYLPSYAEWWQLTDGTVVPPLGLPLVARPWGHAYDLLTLGVVLLPSWLVGPPRGSRVAALAVGAVLGAVILLLGSRAHWVALVVATATALAVWAFARGVRPTRRALVITLSIAVVAVVGFLFFGGPLAERLFTAATIGQRVEMWAAGLEAWLQRPVTGLGPGTFPWILQTTDYFDANSIHARHPDSAIFQLLPEAGILGIAAAGLVLFAVGWPLIRRRQYLVLWPLTFLVIQGLAANPTDFSYLIVVGAIWAGIGLPRTVETPGAMSRARDLRPALFAGMGVAAVPVVAMLIAGLYFDAAVGDVHRDDLASARRNLGPAVTLDPGMALYVRQRGIANLLLDDSDAAVADLTQATRLNPNDDLGWRALSLAHAEAGDADGARAALDRALALQRSDPSNLTLLAQRQAADGDAEGLKETLPEIVLAWPDVLAAPGWPALAAGHSSEDLIASAIARWEGGGQSPEPLRSQPFWLAVIGDRPDLFSRAHPLTGEPDSVDDALAAVTWCEPDAADQLESVPTADRRSSAYWGLRVRQAAEHGESAPDALRLFEIGTFTTPTLEGATDRMNPLRENNERGSVDAWGYDRVVIRWESSPVQLPLPDAGAARWLLDPAGARQAAGFTDGPGSCSPG